jgi:hypothetical protein
MAKTIKFNLILDSKPVRTIEELQENFCIDDILEFYQKGILQKWLKVRGFNEHLNKVEAISDKKSAIIELIRIFELEKSEKEIKEAAYSLEFWGKRKLELEEWNKKDHKIKEIIADYHKGYDVLKAKILENKEDMPFMKNAAKEIFDKYLEIFKIDIQAFFTILKDKAPLMVYIILSENSLREVLLANTNINSVLSSDFVKIIPNNLKISNFSSGGVGYGLNNINGDSYVLETLKYYKKEKNGDWKNITEKKVLIISIPNNSKIRHIDRHLEEITSSEANGHFLILESLSYQNSHNEDELIYMEI